MLDNPQEFANLKYGTRTEEEEEDWGEEKHGKNVHWDHLHAFKGLSFSSEANIKQEESMKTETRD